MTPLVTGGGSKFASYGAHVQHALAVHTFVELGLPDILIQHSKPLRAVELGKTHDMHRELISIITYDGR